MGMDELMKKNSWLKRLFLLTAGFLAAAPLLHGQTVSENALEFYATGDFDGDSQWDIAIVDKETGRVRVGYRLTSEFFNWVAWREGGTPNVTGVSVGKLVNDKRDSLAITSGDKNATAIFDAPDAKVPADPVPVPSNVQGPNAVVAVDIGGTGNTPLLDLYIASIYNSDPANRATLLRNDGKTLTQISESPIAGAEGRSHRLTLRAGGPEFVATISTVESGESLLVKNLASGKSEEVLSVPGVPAGAEFVTGNFRGAPLKEFIFYTREGAELNVRAVEESGGKFTTAAKTVTLSRPLVHLTSIEGKKSRLLGVFGENEPAEVMDFDGANAPATAQKLYGATNKFLKGGIVLPDAIVLFSTSASVTNIRPHNAESYQIHVLKGESYVPGAYGGLPDTLDRDDATIPDIYARIITNSTEKTTADMKPYTNTIPGTEAEYEMVPIPAGEFVMGTPKDEAKRNPDEGPQHRVKIAPFWMGKYEVTWDQFSIFQFSDDEKKMRDTNPTPEDVNKVSDAVTRPSKPYVPMDFGMGKSGFPAIAMTHHAANKFCHWLSAKTGHFYRLPTEAEWEYACRAGTTNAYSFGDDPKLLPDYGWFFDNSNEKYQRVGRKKANPWGLYDMHGNVMEWVLDQYAEDTYAKLNQDVATDPWIRATQPYPHAARGGSWDDDAEQCRSGARRGSDRTWKATDPQLPKSIWYLSDSRLIGLRVVRPLTVPSAEDMKKYWISGVEKD